MVRGARAFFLLSLCMASASCAEARCAPVLPDAEADSGLLPGDADSGVQCSVAFGRAVIGPVMIQSLGFIPCSSRPGQPVQVVLYDELGGRRAWSFECGVESDYLDLGEVPAGHYLVAVEDGGDLVGAGGALLGRRVCSVVPYPSRFCAPLELVVRPCELSVVPVSLRCDPVLTSGCEAG